MVDTPAPTRGFTLIELLVTLAVASILVTVAVPSFQSFVKRNSVTSQANDLIAMLNLARSEAVKRGVNVEVCASSNGTSCTGTWTQGWIVRDASGVIRVQSALSGGSTLSAGTTTITFTPNGRTTLAAATTLTLCPSNPAGTKGRDIEIERTGRPRVAEVTCS